MYKFIIWFVLLFLLIRNDLFSQSDYPKSYLNLGVGIGANYAEGIGVKSVIGYKNSGLLLGIGSMLGASVIGYEIGGQVSYKWWFLNLTYGAKGLINNENMDNGVTFMTGGMVNLEKSKRLFLEIGLGFTTKSRYKPSIINFEDEVPTFNLGLSYRFGGKSLDK
jgi:hypothetical protein